MKQRANLSDDLSQLMQLKDGIFQDRSLKNMQFKKIDCLELNQFYKQHKDKARAKPSDLMFVAINEGTIQAGLRLLNYRPTSGDIDGGASGEYLFLRSVLTAPVARGQGIASGLLAHAINECSLPIYTLPTLTAIGLYKKLGFKAVDTADIPSELSSSYRRFRQSAKVSTVMVINN